MWQNILSAVTVKTMILWDHSADRDSGDDDFNLYLKTDIMGTDTGLE